MARSRTSRRQRGFARSVTIPEKASDRRAYERLHLEVIASDAELAANDAQRPKTRGECVNGPRPCPWISCPHHLFADVTEAGALKINFPGVEPTDLAESCSLDVAERGGITLEEVGEITNVTRERARQIELTGLVKLGINAKERGIEQEDLAALDGPRGYVEDDVSGVGGATEMLVGYRPEVRR